MIYPTQKTAVHATEIKRIADKLEKCRWDLSRLTAEEREFLKSAPSPAEQADAALFPND